jgi:hypothetical protein
VLGVLAVVVAATAPGLPAAAPAPTLEIDAPRTAFSVGDRVPLRVEARAGGDGLWGDLSVHVQPGGAWEVVDGPTAVPEASPPAWRLTLVPMQVGDLALPEMAATLRPAGGPPVQVAPPEAPRVTVASVLPPGEEVEPAPLREPVGVHGVPWEWVVPALPLLLPLLAAAWWWRRRRRVGAADGRPTRSPIDERDALVSKLQRRVGRDPAEALCDRLAAGTRRYLERRTGHPALEMTSFELRLLGRREEWPEQVRRSLQRVTELADGVRFGRAATTDAELRAALAAATELGRELESCLAGREADTAALAEVAS